MALHSRKFYKNLDNLENDLTFAHLLFKMPDIGVEKYYLFSSFILCRFQFKAWSTGAPEKGKQWEFW